MAAPNIVNVATITGKTVGAGLSTSSADIVVNTSDSGKLIKVNTVIVSNVDGAGSSNVTVGVYDSSATTTYRLAYLITVPANASLDILSKPIYLEEGDKIVALASSNSDLEIIVSYEEIS
jgi:hypothetical protein